MTTAIRVRPVQVDDLPAMVALCAQHAAFERAGFEPDGAGRDALQARLRQRLFAAPPQLMAWVACIDDVVAGYASGSVEYSTWQGEPLFHLDCLYLCESARGRGLGRALVRTAAAAARALGCERMEWQTPLWNESAIAFYRALGAQGAEKMRFSLAMEAGLHCSGPHQECQE